LITKYDQRDDKALVLAPVGSPPVPAFSETLYPGFRDTIVRDAQRALEEVLV
jgi:hypothetical protein